MRQAPSGVSSRVAPSCGSGPSPFRASSSGQLPPASRRPSARSPTRPIVPSLIARTNSRRAAIQPADNASSHRPRSQSAAALREPRSSSFSCRIMKCEGCHRRPVNDLRDDDLDRTHTRFREAGATKPAARTSADCSSAAHVFGELRGSEPASRRARPRSPTCRRTAPR